jgi:hypothetical protein
MAGFARAITALPPVCWLGVSLCTSRRRLVQSTPALEARSLHSCRPGNASRSPSGRSSAVSQRDCKCRPCAAAPARPRDQAPPGRRRDQRRQGSAIRSVIAPADNSASGRAISSPASFSIRGSILIGKGCLREGSNSQTLGPLPSLSCS